MHKKWVHLRCACEHICFASVAGWMFDAASAEVMQLHLVSSSWYRAFHPLAVVTLDVGMDVEYAAEMTK